MAKHSIHIQPGDIVTPANFLTAIGLALVVYGSINLTTAWGVWALLAGRILDVLDGPLARATHTSRFGAFLDAASDKLAMLALLVACWHYHVAPFWVVTYILGYNLVSAGLSIATEFRGGRPEATKAGKYAVFLQNVVLIIYASDALLSTTNMRLIAIGMAIAGLVLSLGALEGYTARLIKVRRSSQ